MTVIEDVGSGGGMTPWSRSLAVQKSGPLPVFESVTWLVVVWP